MHLGRAAFSAGEPPKGGAIETRTRLLFALVLTVCTGLTASDAVAGYQLVDYWYEPGYVYPYGPPVYAPPPVYVAPPVYYVAPQGPAPAQSWYYCDNPPGYYPNVPSCNGSWRQVHVTAPR